MPREFKDDASRAAAIHDFYPSDQQIRIYMDGGLAQVQPGGLGFENWVGLFLALLFYLKAHALKCFNVS